MGNSQEAYNKLCKIAAKDAMSVELGLEKDKHSWTGKEKFVAKVVWC